MKKKPIGKVESEVRRLNDRVAGAEAVSRLIVRVQIDGLAKAEELRRLALAAVQVPRSRRADTKFFQRRMDALEAILKDLLPFHKKNRVPKAVLDILKPRKKARRG